MKKNKNYSIIKRERKQIKKNLQGLLLPSLLLILLLILLLSLPSRIFKPSFLLKNQEPPRKPKNCHIYGFHKKLNMWHVPIGHLSYK